MLRAAITNSAMLAPIAELDECEAQAQADILLEEKPKRSRQDSTESMDAPASIQPSPLMAADLAIMAEDLGILNLPPSALSVGSTLITTTVHPSDLPDGAVDITEKVVYDQHRGWQTKLRAVLESSKANDMKAYFMLTEALEGDPHRTLRTVMKLSRAQVEMLPESAAALINTTRSRVLERMRNLSAGKPAPRRYDISNRA